jgi:hypothetical protein
MSPLFLLFLNASTVIVVVVVVVVIIIIIIIIISSSSSSSSSSKSRDSSVGIALGYELDDWGSRVRFPAEAGDFSLYHRVQNGSGAHPAPYPMGTRGSFPGGKAAGA